MAIPQCAMAHWGSSFAIRSNCGCASSYQKSCSKATPRLKGARTDGEQETGKDTFPKRSAAGVAGVADAADAVGAACAARGRAVNAMRSSVNIFIAWNYRTERPLT